MKSLFFLFSLLILFCSNGTSQTSAYEKYNKRLKLYNEREKQLRKHLRVDTILSFNTNNMDSAKYSFEKSDRSYLIYKYKGKVYVDYVNYLKPFVYNEASISTFNIFPEGFNVFNYFFTNNIANMEGVPFIEKLSENDNMSGFSSVIKYGNNAHNIGTIQIANVQYNKEDKRIKFFEYLLRCLRKDGF